MLSLVRPSPTPLVLCRLHPCPGFCPNPSPRQIRSVLGGGDLNWPRLSYGMRGGGNPQRTFLLREQALGRDGRSVCSHFPLSSPWEGCSRCLLSPNTLTHAFPDGYLPSDHEIIASISSPRATTVSHCCLECELGEGLHDQDCREGKWTPGCPVVNRSLCP